MIAPGKLKRKPPGSGAGPSVGFAVRYRKKNRNLTSFMPLPRKQIMNGNEVSSTWFMISLTHFKAERKGDFIVIISQEIIWALMQIASMIFVTPTPSYLSKTETTSKPYRKISVTRMQHSR